MIPQVTARRAHTVAASGGGGGSSFTLTFASNGDTNGLFYWLGSNAGVDTFYNPSTIADAAANGVLHPLDIWCSTFLGQTGGPYLIPYVTARDTSPFHSTNSADNWVRADLPSGYTMKVTRCSLKARSDSTTNNPKNFRFEGSNDLTNWTTLATNSTDMVRYEWRDWAVSDNTFYKYLRVLQTGTNASGNQYFAFDEFEFYGTLQAA